MTWHYLVAVWIENRDILPFLHCTMVHVHNSHSDALHGIEKQLRTTHLQLLLRNFLSVIMPNCVHLINEDFNHYCSTALLTPLNTPTLNFQVKHMHDVLDTQMVGLGKSCLVTNTNHPQLSLTLLLNNLCTYTCILDIQCTCMYMYELVGTIISTHVEKHAFEHKMHTCTQKHKHILISFIRYWK